MIFESFLQNYIKNFEEQEFNSLIMEKLKRTRLFNSWKQVAKQGVKDRKEEKHTATAKDLPSNQQPRDQKLAESSSFDMNNEIEGEYMELVSEFRRVHHCVT